MGNFNRGGKRSGGGFNRGFGDKKSFGGGNRRGGGRDGDRPSMHQAVCSECGNSCEVPFRPTGDKPVYCSDCFSKQGKGISRSDRFGSRPERARFTDKAEFEAICDKCGNSCTVPFRPTGEKPVYCNDCFGKGSSNNNSAPSRVQVARYDTDTAKELKSLNAKIDELIKLLAPKDTAKTKAEASKVVAELKPAKAKTKAKTTAKKVVAKKKK